MSNERYEEMTDEQIVQLAQAGEEPALVYLLNKYKNFVRSKARSYFLIGADHEDIVQEGMIGLRSSPRSKRLRGKNTFRSTPMFRSISRYTTRNRIARCWT